MTIRTRLTFWYGIVLFFSLLLCGLFLFHEWVLKPHRHSKRIGDEDHDAVTDLIQSVLIAAIPAVLLGLGGGWWMMRKALSPVAALTDAVERVSEKNLNVQLPRTWNGDEFDRLTGVFNSMTNRLADSFHRIQDFTLRASHELKTPLTIMRGELETALSDPKLNEAGRENLLDELDEIERLTRIVDGLTLLTKADAGLIKLKREPIRLDELLRDIFADAQVLGRPFNIRVELKECEESMVNGDNHRLRQVLLNLADNAVNYNEPGGIVTLSLGHSAKLAELKVSNTGPGVHPAMLARLFDPFFRGDRSHARTVDGCGLGLAIARCIVTAQGGTIELASEPSGLTTATMRLPLAHELTPVIPNSCAK